MSIKTDLEAVARSIQAEAEKIEGAARHDLNRLEQAVETLVAILGDIAVGQSRAPAPESESEPESEPEPTPEPEPEPAQDEKPKASKPKDEDKD